MDRYVIDSYGPDDEALLEALRWLVRAAHAAQAEAAIVVPAVRSIDSLTRVLGQDLANYASKHRTITLDGVTVRVFTPKTQPHAFDGPIFVAWADTEMVEDAERLSPSAICATGWSEGGLDDWKRAWGPTDPRTGSPDQPALAAGDAVRGAVASLSGPLGNDVVHPMDKRRAVTAFRALRLAGEHIDPVLLRALAIRHGWRPDAADRLAEMRGSSVRGAPFRAARSSPRARRSGALNASEPMLTGRTSSPAARRSDGPSLRGG